MTNLKSEEVEAAANAAMAGLPMLGRTPADRVADAELVGALLIPQVPVPVQSAAIATLGADQSREFGDSVARRLADVDADAASKCSMRC